jgi:hypothetical protein
MEMHDMRTAKLMTAAGLLVAVSVIGGTLIGGVLASPGGNSNANTLDDADSGLWLAGDAAEYCDVYLDTLANELGVSRDDLLPASKAAAIAAIDAAVAGGDLDEERAAQIKERIETVADAGCGFIGALGRSFAHGFGHGFAHGFVSADTLDAAAEALGIDGSELLSQLADGSSLQQIASREGVSYDTVKTAVMGALQDDLDAAVANGLDQERSAAIAERVQTWLDEGGEPGFGRPFGRFHHGEGPSSDGAVFDGPTFQSQ